jgi:hypothetical protein
MGNPLIAGFVEMQHKANFLAWNGKTTEDQDSPSDCHKTAEIMADEGALSISFHSFLCKFVMWSQVLHQSRT